MVRNLLKLDPTTLLNRSVFGSSKGSGSRVCPTLTTLSPEVCRERVPCLSHDTRDRSEGDGREMKGEDVPTDGGRVTESKKKPLSPLRKNRGRFGDDRTSGVNGVESIVPG